MNYEYDRKFELNAVAVGTGRDLYPYYAIH